MLFSEKLTLVSFCGSLISRKTIFYGTSSVPVRIAEKLLVRLHITSKVQKLDFGNLDQAPDIRKNAYETAQKYLVNIEFNRWANEISQLLKINFNLIAKKFFFDELYIKYEFYEMALRYAIENHEEQHLVSVQALFFKPYDEKLKKYFQVSFLKVYPRLSFLGSLFWLPLYLMYCRKQKGIKGSLRFNDEIVCYIDDESTYEMYSNIFKNGYSPRYVIEKHYAKGFTIRRLRDLKIHILGLTEENFQYLRKITHKYIALCLNHRGTISKYGVRVFWLFYILIRGKTDAVSGNGNFIFTYEHLVTEKAARNEFIRAEGSQTIFIPKNAHASPRYFHSENYINYDVMCSAGQHIEELYQKKNSLTEKFLPAGSYDSHRRIVDSENKNKRSDTLKAFKGDSVAITILSPGICDPTYSHEIKLMKLAQKLAEQDGIKVFIRLKPVPLIPKYADFYTPFVEKQNSIMLTAAEFELFDFLEVTDLFVTSISNSACDVAMCGASVMFIDLMKTPDIFLYWSVVPDVVLPENEAFKTIMAWIDNNGDTRDQFAKTMNQLSEYIGYNFNDFDSYKANLLSQLQKNVFGPKSKFNGI